MGVVVVVAAMAVELVEVMGEVVDVEAREGD